MIASHFARLIIHGWLKNHLHFISYNFNLLSWQFLSASGCMKQGTLPAFPGLSTGDPLVMDKRISLSPVSTGFPRHHCGDGGLVAKLSATFRDPMDYVAHQALLSMGFSSSGLPFPSPGDLPNPGIKPMSPALQMDSLLLSHQGRNALKCIMNMLK